MKTIATISVYGITPVPWTVPNIGTGRRKNGTKFRFMTRTRKSNANDGTPSLETWQRLIREEAERVMGGREPCEGPVSLNIQLLERTPPGKRDGQIWFPGIKQNDEGEWVKCGQCEPDLTNLVKGVEDALEGVVYRNDFQVRMHTTDMWYQECPGVEIVAYEIQESEFPGDGEIVPEYETPKPARKRRAKK